MPNRKLRLALVGLALCGPAVAASTGAADAPARAAPAYNIKVWETDEGLPQNSVIAMAQTHDGFLWLGTLNGLARFDGVGFTTFDEGTPGLNSSQIVYLFEDRQRRLWIGTATAGIVLVQAGQVTPTGIGQGGRERRLVAACDDGQGTVWLCNANGELWRFADGRFAPFLLGPSQYRTVIAETSGRVWLGSDRRQSALAPLAAAATLSVPLTQELPVGKMDFLLARTRGGFWRLADGQIQKWSADRLESEWKPYPWGEGRVSAACEDRQGNLVVGTLGAGVFWFDAHGHATRLSTQEGLSHNWILSLLVDLEGTLWVGTDGGGLNRVKRQVFEPLEASRDLVAQSVVEEAQGGLWVGAHDGLSYWHRGVGRSFLTNTPVSAIFMDQRQRLWVGTRGAGLYQVQGEKVQRVPGPAALQLMVQAVHQDRAGLLWFGTPGGLVRWDERDWKVLTTRDGMSSDVVTALAEARDGSLWIGTADGGLNRLHDGRWSVFRKDQQGLPSDRIASLWLDAEEVLWIGTSGGLARWDGRQWTRYSAREGLVSSSIGYLLEDRHGNLWAGSTAGLMRLPKPALNDFALGRTTFIPCRAYGKADGLLTGECTLGAQPGPCRTRDGVLWFPTIKGLVSVDPALLNPNTNRPPVRIEAIFVEGELQGTQQLGGQTPAVVIVPPGKKRLEIHYASLNLGAPERARFRYRLEGHESGWTDAGNVRVARYSRLPPDRYRFQVTACNEDGVWNETGQTLAVIVQPPFWRTWWFLSAAAVGLLCLVVTVVHYLSAQRLQRQLEGLRQQQALEQERSRIARDMHDQVGASLTQISLLGELVESDKDAPGEVEVHARQIAQTARETTRILDEIVWAVNPANDTLDGLITYCCKHAQEYLAVAGLRCRVEVPAQLPAVVLPPDVRHHVFLAAKEAVTNVVRHAQASTVHLRLRLAPRSFTLEIEDDGRGLAALDPKAAQSRNGLRNMRKRLEEIGGAFELAPAATGGTLVRLTAPSAPSLALRQARPGG